MWNLCGARQYSLYSNDAPISSQSFFSQRSDGQFNISEHWELAENMHMAFLQTDANHSDNYNYIYTSRVQNHLYMMVDLCSDITNTTTNANWIASGSIRIIPVK